MSGSRGANPSRKPDSPLTDREPVVSPWKAWSQYRTRGLPVAYRANFSAVSTASVPLLPKNTRSRCGLYVSSFSASSPGSGWQSKRVRSAREASRTSCRALRTTG